MNTGDKYEDNVARLRALLDKAIAKGELPAELLPENQHSCVVDRARLERLREVVVSGDFDALLALSEESSPLALNRGELDQSGSDAALEAAREMLRKRRAQEQENQDGGDSGHSERG